MSTSQPTNEASASSESIPLPPGIGLLYENGPCLIFNKPPGILTQASPGVDSLEVQLKEWIKKRDRKSGNVYLATVHRLDRPVSGAIAFARHMRAARRLAEQFEARQVKKLYWACVTGKPDPGEGRWEDFLRKIPNVPQAEIVPPDHEEGRHAVLHYRTLGETAHGAWLEIELETGRMHQIRIQAASRGFPILGDAQYGSTVPFGEQFDDVRERAIALHARRLMLRHPMTHDRIDVTAPLPAAWKDLHLPTG